jgi:ATP-dependent Clp protease ATP-binding subunit ClpC
MAESASAARHAVLDPDRRSQQVARFETMLRERVVGQQPAIEAVLDSFSKILAGIRNQERPLLTLLFLGPTGVGKTETVKALAEAVFGKRNAFVRVNCQEFSSEFTVSKLFGSPPGYVGTTSCRSCCSTRWRRRIPSCGTRCSA